MRDLIELKQLSIDFRRLSSNLLCSDYKSAEINLVRFKNYIDSTPIIVEILGNKMTGKENDFRKTFPIHSNGDGEIKIPEDEGEHIKAIYDLISHIVLNRIRIFSISYICYCSSRKIDDIIQNFLTITVKPLIDYIRDEISKEIILQEDKNMSKFNITGNQNSSINIALESEQHVSNNINIVDKDIIDKIEKIKEELNNNPMIDEEEKESIEDDLDVIKEQIDNSIKKPTRLKKAYANIVNFFEKSSGVISKVSALGIRLQELIDIIKSFVEKI